MFLFIYNITPTDIRKNQTANHGMNVFIRELLAIFLRKVFAEIHLATNQRRRNILMHYCPRNSFNISKSNKLIVTHQN